MTEQRTLFAGKLLAACCVILIFAVASLWPMPQGEPEHSKLDSDFLKAIAKANIGSMKRLAAQGANADPPGRAAFDVYDVQKISGGYQYLVGPGECAGGSQPMLDAIGTARPATVQALIELGVDLKRHFCEDALSNTFFGVREIYAAIVHGSEIRVNGRQSLRTSGLYVLSSIRPTAATKATYLSVAERLRTANEGKRRSELDKIVDLLRQAGSPEP